MYSRSSTPPLPLNVRKPMSIIKCHAPLFLPWELRHLPPFVVAQGKKKEGHPKSWTLHTPHTNPSSPLHLEWFYKIFAATSWASKRASLSDSTTKKWRRKVLLNERKRRKKKALLTCAQPWRRSSSSRFFFSRIKSRLDLIFNMKI